MISLKGLDFTVTNGKRIIAFNAQKRILEGWNCIQEREKEYITSRLEDIFEDGLPRELFGAKPQYRYAFSFLTQLKILALQIPLQWLKEWPNSLIKQKIYVQFVDELLHALVFSRIVNLLTEENLDCTWDANVEIFCDHLQVESPQIGLFIFNLFNNGWLSEVFVSLAESHIAPHLFGKLSTKKSHYPTRMELCNYIGKPNKELLQYKLDRIESLILPNLLFDYNYALSFSLLLGIRGTLEFLESLDKQHTEQLNEVNLQPSENWVYYVRHFQEQLPRKVRRISHYF